MPDPVSPHLIYAAEGLGLKIPKETPWEKLDLASELYDVMIECQRCDLGERGPRLIPAWESVAWSLNAATHVRLVRVVWADGPYRIATHIGQCRDCLTIYWTGAQPCPSRR